MKHKFSKKTFFPILCIISFTHCYLPIPFLTIFDQHFLNQTNLTIKKKKHDQNTAYRIIIAYGFFRL